VFPNKDHTNGSTVGIEIVGVRSSMGSKESTNSPSFRRLMAIAIDESYQPTIERNSIEMENIKN
jgi:hypothetical protein